MLPPYDCCLKNVEKTDPCDSAAFWEKLCCLKYARNHGHIWNTNVWTRACQNADFVILQYALDNACPINVQTFELGCCKNLETLQFMRSTVGCTTWNEETCALFSRRGRLNCLRYARENGCPWNERTTLEAAMHGQLHCLQYAYEAGCSIGVSFCLEVVQSRNSSIECLKFGIDHGALTDDPQLMMAAARHYNSEFLSYLHQRGLPLTEHVVLETVKQGHIDSFIYCMQHKCPFDLNLCLLVAQANKNDFYPKYQAIHDYCIRLANGHCKSDNC
jgi:hypothetical protein